MLLPGSRLGALTRSSEVPRCAERLGDIDCDPLPEPLAPARNGERGSAAADKAALLAFTEIMVQVHRERVQGTHVDAMSISWPLSWRRTTAPCDRHVDEKRLGWAGVMCDAVDGRVVYLSLSDAGPAPACQDAHALNIGYLQPLARLETLDMGQCQSVVGNIEWLATLTELRFLNLYHASVHGNISSLGALTHLGEPYRAPDGGRGSGLFLGATSVTGSVAPLRRLPFLGPDWGGRSTFEYTSCATWLRLSGFPPHRTPGSATGIPDWDRAADGWNCYSHDNTTAVVSMHLLAGRDPCACCPQGAVALSLEYNTANGACAIPPSSATATPTTSSNPAYYGYGYSRNRPWTGQAIREAEPVIVVVCVVALICLGLRWLLPPLKDAGSVSNALRMWADHSAAYPGSSGGAADAREQGGPGAYGAAEDDTGAGVGALRRARRGRQPQPRTPVRPPAFAFGGGGGGGSVVPPARADEAVDEERGGEPAPARVVVAAGAIAGGQEEDEEGELARAIALSLEAGGGGGGGAAGPAAESRAEPEPEPADGGSALSEDTDNPVFIDL